MGAEQSSDSGSDGGGGDREAIARANREAIARANTAADNAEADNAEAVARANRAADNAEAAERKAQSSAGQASIDAGQIGEGAQYTDRAVNFIDKKVDEAGSAASGARKERIGATMAATGSNIQLRKATTAADLAGQHKDDSMDYADTAEQEAELASKLSGKARGSAYQAEGAAANAYESAHSASQQLGATVRDLDEVKNIINTLAYTGFNAGQIFLEETALNERLDLIEEKYKSAIELQLYHFKLEKEKYFDNFEDDELKFKALNDMFLYMVDYFLKYKKTYYPDNELNLMFLDYIINKTDYNKSGNETLKKKLYEEAKVLKSVLVPTENFSNMFNLKNNANNILNKIKHSFTNIIEGNTPMSGSETTTNPTSFVDIIRGFLTQDAATIIRKKHELQTNINHIKRYQDGEFLAQRDTIMNNVLMDYMINNEEGSNIEQVYGKLNQEKNDKLRKTKIAAYYTKSFKEYIYLLKIVIFLIVLMIPILIFKRLEILDKSLTLLLVVIIITLGFLYISYRLYILYTRDSKDFDKFKIPFTRTEAANLKSKGSRYSKDSPLKSLGITCIGEECCDASMVYDKLRDKCVTTENFGNYFENAQELNNQQKNIIKENNSHEDESNFAFLGGNANVIENFRSMGGMKQELLLNSLNNSSERKFNN